MSGMGRDDRPRLPLMFWVYAIVLGLFIVYAVLQALVVRSERTTILAVSLVGSMVLVGVIIGGFALSVMARQRRARDAFPDAVIVPIMVGSDLGRESTRLSEILAEPAVRLRPSTYAALAFDRSGLHVVTSAGQMPGSLPAAQVEIAGAATTAIGTRTVPCLMLTVLTDRGTVPLPVVPMRLGNPLRLFSTTDLLRIAEDLDAALAGRPVSPGWSY